MRTLVSKKRIDSLEEIPGADRIELAHIGGWQCIVRKGEFTIGADCIFHEIGCFLPFVTPYAFLKGDKFQNGTKGTRIKTMKMKGVISQGLALPLSSFSDFIHALPYDTDLSSLLGVTKWEDDVVDYNLNSRGEKVSTFPEFIRKTDEERIQNLTKQYWTEIANHDFYVTLKLHGSSCTVYYKDGHLGVCSRNQEIEETEGNAYWRAVRESGIDKAVIKMCHLMDAPYAFQCELVGPKINGNMDKFENLQLYVFSIWDINNQIYLKPNYLYNFCRDFDLKVVPCLGIISECEHTIPELLAMANGPSINCAYREGVVFKRADGKFSFKAISNDFLLKEKD